MRYAIRTLAFVIASLVSGIAVWLGVAWTLSVIADRAYSATAEHLLAAVSPLAFGPLVALVVAAIVFLLMRRHVSPQ